MTAFALAFLSVAVTQAAPDGGASNAVLLDFTAEWCQPCQQMNPIVDRLKREGYDVRKVDVDRERELAQRFKITGMPTFVLVVDGREVQRIVGATSEEKLRALLAQAPRPGANDGRDQRPLAANEPSRPAAAPQPGRAQAAAERRGIQLPFFGRKKSSEEPPAEPEPTIRAQKADAPAAGASPPASSPMASSTRIRVKDNGTVNFGSGTVIESRPGRAVILTCGHIFRDLSDKASIEVDVFRNGQVLKYQGQVVRYDLKADVGLLAIPADVPLSVSKVARPERSAREGDAVLSIGCGGGEVPSQQQLRVTALNRYFGPENIECTGVPVPGRSGGGLFNSAGEVVGVCFAADQRDRRGLYAGLKPIHGLLEQSGLAHLCPPACPPPDRSGPVELAETGRREPAREPTWENGFAFDAEPDFAATPAAAETPDFDSPAFADADDDAEPPFAFAATEQESDDDEGPSGGTADVRPGRGELDPETMAEIQKGLDHAGEAEVICVIRPLDDPQAASRVVIINRASSKFLSYLSGELDDQPRHTNARVRTDGPECRPAAAAPQRYVRSAESR